MTEILIAIAALCQVPNGMDFWNGYKLAKADTIACQKWYLTCVDAKSGPLDVRVWNCIKERVE